MAVYQNPIIELQDIINTIDQAHNKLKVMRESIRSRMDDSQNQLIASTSKNELLNSQVNLCYDTIAQLKNENDILKSQVHVSPISSNFNGQSNFLLNQDTMPVPVAISTPTMHPQQSSYPRISLSQNYQIPQQYDPLLSSDYNQIYPLPQQRFSHQGQAQQQQYVQSSYYQQQPTNNQQQVHYPQQQQLIQPSTQSYGRQSMNLSTNNAWQPQNQVQCSQCQFRSSCSVTCPTCQKPVIPTVFDAKLQEMAAYEKILSEIRETREQLKQAKYQ